jgi:hypothetical protein
MSLPSLLLIPENSLHQGAMKGCCHYCQGIEALHSACQFHLSISAFADPSSAIAATIETISISRPQRRQAALVFQLILPNTACFPAFNCRSGLSLMNCSWTALEIIDILFFKLCQLNAS